MTTTRSSLRTSSPDWGGHTVTVVSIPTSVGLSGPRYVKPSERTVDPTAERARAAATWNLNAKALTRDQRHVWSELYAGGEVEVAALTDAIVASLAATATRYGQSATRTAHRDLLTDTWAWLLSGAPVPSSVSWTTGAPVTVTVSDDGTVTVSVDLSEITDRHAAEDVPEEFSSFDAEVAFEAADAALDARGSYYATVTL